MEVEENPDQWKLGKHISSGFSFVGVVADVSRADEAEYNSKTCCVFGLTEQEWLSIKNMKDDAIKPSTFYETAPRFKVNMNPFLTMRILGEKHGFMLPAQPLIAQAQCSDSKVVVVWTLAKKP